MWLVDKLRTFADNPHEVATDNLGKSLLLSSATIAVATGLLAGFTTLPLVIGAIGGLAAAEIVLPLYGMLANLAVAAIDTVTPKKTSLHTPSPHKDEKPDHAPSSLWLRSLSTHFTRGNEPHKDSSQEAAVKPVLNQEQRLKL